MRAAFVRIGYRKKSVYLYCDTEIPRERTAGGGRLSIGAFGLDARRWSQCPAKILFTSMTVKQKARYEKIKNEYEDFIEGIVDELLNGDPDHALRRLESAGYDLEDLRA